VDEAVRKARILIEALSWIRQFRGRDVVIKLGGSALEEKEAVRNLLLDVVFMESVGMRPILVHGGGKAISGAMAEAGIEPRWVSGRRYTDDTTMKIASETLADVCESLVDGISVNGGEARGLNFRTQNCLIGEKLTLPGDDGEAIDLGRVGHVVDIDRDLLDKVASENKIPVIPSVAMDRDGNLLNINADTAAAAIARLLGAEKLVFLSDVPGIFRDKNDPSTLLSHLEVAECRNLIQTGIVDAGMVPKVEAALEALEAGVQKVHIIDGRVDHSVLLEIYSNAGIGTEIV